MAIEISSIEMKSGKAGIPICRVDKNKAIFVGIDDFTIKRVDYLKSSDKYKIVKLAKLELDRYGQIRNISTYGKISADIVEKAREAIINKLMYGVAQ